MILAYILSFLITAAIAVLAGLFADTLFENCKATILTIAIVAVVSFCGLFSLFAKLETSICTDFYIDYLVTQEELENGPKEFDSLTEKTEFYKGLATKNQTLKKYQEMNKGIHKKYIPDEIDNLKPFDIENFIKN